LISWLEHDVDPLSMEIKSFESIKTRAVADNNGVLQDEEISGKLSIIVTTNSGIVI